MLLDQAYVFIVLESQTVVALTVLIVATLLEVITDTKLLLGIEVLSDLVDLGLVGVEEGVLKEDRVLQPLVILDHVAWEPLVLEPLFVLALVLDPR